PSCEGHLHKGQSVTVNVDFGSFRGIGRCHFTLEGVSTQVKGYLTRIQGRDNWDCIDAVQEPGPYDILNPGTYTITFVKGVSSPAEGCGKINIEDATEVPNSTLRYKCEVVSYAE